MMVASSVMSNSLKQVNSASGAAAAPQTTNETDAGVSAILSEEFQILRELTKTRACSTYLARDLRAPAGGDPDTAGLVRLKVLSGPAAGDARQVELFRLEASAAASLSHRNIVKAESAEEVGGVHFCVTEQRPGLITLGDHLKKKGWLSADEAVRVCQQIADALEYAHGHGVLHLALRPEDVLLDEDGNVFVTGFGISRSKELLWARQERSHHCAARYISPEQVVAADADQRSDLYLLGLLLYEMLTDRAPFESGDETSLRLKHLTRTPEPPHTFRQELSRALSQIVMDLLAKRPDGRPFCASTLKAALERCVASGLIADEEEEVEETEAWAQSADYAPLRLMAAEGIPDRARTYEENQDSSPMLATQGEEAAGLEYEENQVSSPAADETAPAGYGVDPGAEFQDPPPVYEPAFINDGYAASDSEFEGEHVEGDSTQVASYGQETPEADEYEPRESLTVPQGLPSEESSNKRARRLAWLAVLALLGAGLFWEMRAARFHRMKPELAQMSPVAGPLSNGESAAAGEEITVPTPEVAAPMESEESSPISEAVIPAADGGSFDNRKDAGDATQKKQAEETTAEKSPPPERSSIAPPVLPTLEPDGAAAHDPAAESYKERLSDAQPQEPAPAPEQPAKEQAPALKVVRKSGDVLQNTAIIRTRPIYPKAARAAAIKGAVTVEVTIDEDGGVLAARPISGPEELRQAAVAAARQWKWVPERVDRGRARVMGTITFNFRD
jgi:TonB family protein